MNPLPPPPWGPAGGEAPKDYTKLQQTIQTIESPKGNTKPQKDYTKTFNIRQKTKNIRQNSEISDENKHIKHKSKILNKSSNKY